MTVNVFFYGLFMDESVVAERGIFPSASVVGYVDGYALRLGTRAALLPEVGARAYGMLMTVDPAKLEPLYAQESVADYVAETVSVTLKNGSLVEARCYNLPEGLLSGANPDYARQLYMLATKLGFPDDYLKQIEREGRTGGASE